MRGMSRILSGLQLRDHLMSIQCVKMEGGPQNVRRISECIPYDFVHTCLALGKFSSVRIECGTVVSSKR